MGGSTFWYIPNKVYIAHFYDVLTPEELQRQSDKGIELIRSGEPPVHIIIDTRFMSEYPTDMSQVLRVTRAFHEENLGWALLISNDPAVRLLAHVVAQLKRTKLKSFTAPDEALGYLKQIDPNLTPLPAYPIQSASDRVSV